MSVESNPASATMGAEPVQHRSQRRTWVSGGVLLLLSVAVGLAARGPLEGLAPLKDGLFAAAGLLLVIGIGRGASITGRRFVGSVSTIILVVVPMTQSAWFALLPHDTGDPNAEEDAWVLLATAYFGFLIVLAVISVIAIIRAGVVPSPWRWAPLWITLWTPATVATGLTLFSAAPLGTPIARFGSLLSLYGPAAGVAFLGILAITLGLRPAPPAAPDERWHHWFDHPRVDASLPRGHDDAADDPAPTAEHDSRKGSPHAGL